jgi:hypothetical protein
MQVAPVGAQRNRDFQVGTILSFRCRVSGFLSASRIRSLQNIEPFAFGVISKARAKPVRQLLAFLVALIITIIDAVALLTTNPFLWIRCQRRGRTHASLRRLYALERLGELISTRQHVSHRRLLSERLTTARNSHNGVGGRYVRRGIAETRRHGRAFRYSEKGPESALR